jgi:hypothetical protein
MQLTSLQTGISRYGCSLIGSTSSSVAVTQKSRVEMGMMGILRSQKSAPQNDKAQAAFQKVRLASTTEV